MGIIADKIRAFQEEKKRLMTMGGEEMIAKQHRLGKLTARERVDLLFDKDTFQEVRLFVKHRSTRFGMKDREIKGDGIVTGFGTVNGRTVFVASHDFTSAGGSLGEMHAKKIWKIMDMAIAAKKPIVFLNDSGGVRIQEGVTALDGGGGIFFRKVIASGYVPQIAAIMGPTAGVAVYSPALTDWVFMVKGSSYMYITGPEVVETVIGEKVTHEELGGAMVHATKSGVCHFATESDEDCIENIKKLLSYLPDSCHSPLPVIECTDSLHRECTELDSIIPDRPRRAYDMRKIVSSSADNGEIFEPHELWAKNIIVAFIRIMGKPVGIVANNPLFNAGVLDINASDKASRFIRFCDSFNIPIVTLADVPGYMPGTEQEWAGIISHGAKLLYSYSEATVPKITVVIRKAYGGAYIGMCSKNLGADYVMAWPSAEMAVLGAEAACSIIHRREIAEAEDPESKKRELIALYEEEFGNPYAAATIASIDEIIAPKDTRKKIAFLLNAFSNKTENLLPKKHSNIPL
jgi:acetyl-CoA carboxylase carboxyltransferase component